MQSQEGSRIAELRELLCRSLTAGELQRFLSDSYGQDLLHELPPGLPFADYCHQAVLALGRRGLVDDHFFKILLRRLPGRSDEITAVGLAWGIQVVPQVPFSNALSNETYGALKGYEAITASPVSLAPNPKRFYLGYAPTWADLSAHIDIARSVVLSGVRVPYEQLLDVVKRGPSTSHLLLVFGEGGSGKTTFLRRMMFDLAQSGNTVLRAYPTTILTISEVLSYSSAISASRAFIFVDDAHAQAGRLLALSDELAAAQSQISIVAAARKNEWNSATEHCRLSDFSTSRRSVAMRPRS